MKKKIIFVVPYPIDKAPSQRLKFEQYYSYFEEAGFSITHDSFMNEEMWDIVYKNNHTIKKISYTIISYFKRIRLLFSISSFDIVYVHLWSTPFGFPIYEWILRKLAKRIVYDIDDLVFLKNISHENKVLAFFKGKQKPFYLMEHSNHIITCTPYLDAIAKKYNKFTTDISSTINTENYLPINEYKNDHQLVIGWSGSHSTSQYLYLLENVLMKLAKELDFKLLVIGDPNFIIEGINMKAIEWNSKEEVSLLQKIDIGLYPLPLDQEWVLGKSGLKAIQYMALGIPTVASNIGCINRVINNGVDGFLVSDEDEWFSVLKKLINDEKLRSTIGMKARKKIENQFSVQSNYHKYLDILQKN